MKIPFSSNSIRLSLREWWAALCLIFSVLIVLPATWQRFERFSPDADYRIPFSLGQDYWLYRQYCRWLEPQDRILVAGDSVVWGHYVPREFAISACLNREAKSARFANAGVDGTHPAALAGLMEYYARSIRGKRVIMQCNTLWMSSEKQDLQTDKELDFNHPDLVPQFCPRIPCFRRNVSKRLGTVVARYVPVFGWVDHLRIAYFTNKDVASWTLDHPYSNALDAVTFTLPSPNEQPPKLDVRPWKEKDMAFSPAWVKLDTSFQWASFLRSLDVLRNRGNQVFVVVGPMNEHMMQEESRQTYQERKRQIEKILAEKGIPHHMAPLLPSELYADASHPISEGYTLMAKNLAADPVFRAFCGRQTNNAKETGK